MSKKQRLTVANLKNFEKGQAFELNAKNLRLAKKADGSYVLQIHGLVTSKAVSQSEDVFAAANENTYEWVDLPLVVEKD